MGDVAAAVIELQHEWHRIVIRRLWNGDVAENAHPTPQESSVKTSHTLRVALLTLALGAGTAQAADVTGAGASFVYPVMSKWSSDYAKTTGKKVNYQSIGSGGGIAQIKAGTVDFG
ncbi:MAG: substrate-binding domain-containing protein, partial [Xanthomonadaceae bacterium]|nr:substrate-binding domain-containing protein [Xanthomonadaceae bacterium]